MIIDSHSHIGEDFYNGNIELKKYIEYCKKTNINIGLVMPPPWAIYIKNEKKIVSLLWEHVDNVISSYYSLTEDGKKNEILLNPYLEVNYHLLNIVKKAEQVYTKLFFVPLVHGKLDTPEYLEKLLTNLDIPAVKMHGFGSGFAPRDVTPELIELLQKFDLPIIIHTSVYNYNYGYGYETKFWRNECHPLKWAEFLVKNNLKGVLNHGACLNEETIKLVNNYKELMIGIGPDFDLAHDYLKADVKKNVLINDGYLNILKRKVDSNKILFDVDYNWNVDGEGLLDYHQINRISDIWSQSELEDILGKNALNFFNRLNDDKKNAYQLRKKK